MKMEVRAQAARAPFANPFANIPTTSGPGDPRPGGRVHRGRDYGLSYGSPIPGALDWEVIGQGEDARSGKWARVRFSDGSEHSFAHLSRPPAQKRGRAGQPIAWSGKDADDKNGHLHHRSWVNGQEIDPADYYRRRGGR